MTRYPFPAQRTWNVLFALYLLALVYLTRDSQAGLYLLGFFRAQALSIGLTLAVGLVFLVYNRNRIGSILLDGRVLLFVLFSLTIVIPMAIKRDWQMMYISMIYCIAVAVLISYFAGLRQTARAYILILALLAAWSLLCSYGLRLLADRGIAAPPVFENSFQARFYNYLLCYVPINYAKTRNFGIFREPGVYQFFLFLALYLNNYQADWDSGKRTWGLNALLVTAMLTTFSTCGVAVTAVFLIALYFDRKVYDTPLGRKLSLVLFALLALVAAWLVAAKPPLYTQLKLMVEKLFTSNPSLNDRIDCIKFNLYVIQWDRFVGRDPGRHLQHGEPDHQSLFLALPHSGSHRGAAASGKRPQEKPPKGITLCTLFTPSPPAPTGPTPPCFRTAPKSPPFSPRSTTGSSSRA